MSLTHHQHSVLLERVFSLINEKVDPSQSAEIMQFGQLLLKRMPFDDIDGRSDSDLYGAILSLWQLLQNKKIGEPSIKVFNPEIAKHGWQSSHTIIEMIIDDMPFLVDSIRMAINRFNITSHLILHTPMQLGRNTQGKVTDFMTSDGKAKTHTKETVFFIEIDRQSRAQDLEKLRHELCSVVSEVSLSVSDWAAMQNKLAGLIKDSNASRSTASDVVKSQSKTFLNWLNNHNFTLMGYRYYDVNAIEGDYKWSPINDSSLGLMKTRLATEYEFYQTWLTVLALKP